jgi:hypothetical protein
MKLQSLHLFLFRVSAPGVKVGQSSRVKNRPRDAKKGNGDTSPATYKGEFKVEHEDLIRSYKEKPSCAI